MLLFGALVCWLACRDCLRDTVLDGHTCFPVCVLGGWMDGWMDLKLGFLCLYSLFRFQPFSPCPPAGLRLSGTTVLAQLAATFWPHIPRTHTPTHLAPQLLAQLAV